MSNKFSNLKEKFKVALTSTAKVISDDLILKKKLPKHGDLKDFSKIE